MGIPKILVPQLLMAASFACAPLQAMELVTGDSGFEQLGEPSRSKSCTRCSDIPLAGVIGTASSNIQAVLGEKQPDILVKKIERCRSNYYLYDRGRENETPFYMHQIPSPQPGALAGARFEDSHYLYSGWKYE